MRKLGLAMVVAVLGVFATRGFAEEMKHDMTAMPAEGDVKYGDAPPQLPKGAKMAVLYGDPSKAGALFIVRAKMPANYKIAPHTHPGDENVTILSGEFHLGQGPKMDQKAGKAFKAGGFFSMPAGMQHSAWTTKDTVIEISGMGPFAIQYVNPDDDPSKAVPAKK
jgi:quercetin dioxygenase-like cupin family protein